jgi:DNA-directed RNA polymerase specialized sigma24 family protein
MSDNGRLSHRRARRVVENDEYAAFVRRAIRALGARVGRGDVETLASLVELSSELDTVIAESIAGLRAAGFSYGEIAVRLGVSRQAVRQRWGVA